MRLQWRMPFGIALLRPWCLHGTGGVSTLLAMRCSSGVEHDLAKVGVEGSNPFARSIFKHILDAEPAGPVAGRVTNRPSA